MNFKKVFMIIVLIVFIGIMSVIVINIKEKSIETINEKSKNNNNNISNSSSEQSSRIIRKSTEKLNIDTSNIIEITDNFFIEQTNDIYLNLNDYIGKTIKIEGLIYSYQAPNGDTCYAVVRNTPGCCGSDGLAGLDIRYDEEYPEEDTWVEVIGVVGTDTMYGNEIPAIQIYSMKIKEKGTIFVTK